MNPTLAYLLKRFSEPSSWAGIAGAVAAATVPGIPVVGQVIIGLSALVNVLTPEAAASAPAAQTPAA